MKVKTGNRIVQTAVVCLCLSLLPSTVGDFVNGGFETGDWTGWDKSNGYWYGGVNYVNIANDLGKSAIMEKSMPNDSYTLGKLPVVAYGDYAARVNNADWGFHWSAISQQANWTSDNIFFAWAAVLEEPGNQHPQDAAPHFRVVLKDLTDNVVLYDINYNVYNVPGIFKDGWYDGYNQWKYCDWQIAQLDTSAVIGHDLELAVLGSDCGWGGHGGYVYLDGFSSVKPPPPPGVPDSSTTAMLLGIGVIGLAALRKRLS